MENLGLFIYLSGIADAIIVISAVSAIISAFVGLIYLYSGNDTYDDDRKEEHFSSAKRWGIICGILCLIAIFVPSKRTCYQIFGVTKAVELYRSSESLQQLPEKSIEALNRILDSIAPEEEKAE